MSITYADLRWLVENVDAAALRAWARRELKSDGTSPSLNIVNAYLDERPPNGDPDQHPTHWLFDSAYMRTFSVEALLRDIALAPVRGASALDVVDLAEKATREIRLAAVVTILRLAIESEEGGWGPVTPEEMDAVKRGEP